jgi:F-type H+-transporting ATPase subunit b
MIIAQTTEGEVSGIDLLLPPLPEIVWSLVFLAIIFAVMMKFVWPSLSSAMDERRERIEGGLAQAEAVQDEVNKLRAHQEQELAAARQQAAEIRETAREDAKRMVDEARQRAEDENARVLAQGRQQLDADRASAFGQLRGEVGTLASDLASRIVGESLSDDQRSQRVIDRYLDELETQTDRSGARS